VTDDAEVQDPDDRRRRRADDAGDVLARARADAEQIRRDALVTAEGIRQIAREDARLLGAAGADTARAEAELAALRAHVERLERRLRRQRKRIERLEDVLLGLAPGLRKKR
jgi:hypothetical protein